MKKRISRILAGLLCLLLLVGFLPADILGDLIPEADAAAINFKTWTKDNFNGLYIIRSESDPSLVLTQTGYFNSTLTYQKLGSAGDIRKQMFVFRSSRNSLNSSISLNTTVYFRCLYDVYRYTESGNTSFGNLWVQSGRSDYPASYPLVPQEQGLNAGVPEDAVNSDFGWKLNIYASDTTGDYAGLLKVAICENGTDGDNNASWRYIIRNNNNQAVFSYNSGIYNFAHYLQPVSYGVPDVRNIHLHTSIGTTSHYLQADYGFAANSSVVNYNTNNTDWPTAWSLTQLPNGYHAIISTQHGRYLAISDAGNPTLGNAAGLRNGEWYYPQDAEQWQFIPYYFSGQGFTYLIVNKASGRLLLRSASGNTHLCDSYYTVSEQCNRWMITYNGTDLYNASVHSNAGYVAQTGYNPATYTSSTAGINYPIQLKTGTGAAYSNYHTLKLNPASTITGHFSDTDNAAANATLESRFDSTSGYVFDTRFLTDPAYNLWAQAISYSNGVIQNTLNQYRSNLLSTGKPPHPFKPVGSSSYTAVIQFQFKYTSGMFLKYNGGNYSFHIAIQSADLSTSYYDSWIADTDLSADFSKLTVGQTYTLTISKDSNSDANSHFWIFTNVQPVVLNNELDSAGKTKLFNVGINVYQDGSKLALNGAAKIGSPLEYGITITNKSVYNLLVQSFSSPTPTDNAEQISHWGNRNLNGFTVTSAGAVTPGSAIDKNGNAIALDDLVFNVYDANGNSVKSLTSPNASTLSNFLTHVPNSASTTSYGLPNNWTIEVRGIFYQPTQADLDTYARKMVYPYVTAKFHVPGDNTAVSKYGDNTSTHFTNEPFFIQWAGQEMNISSGLLYDLVVAAGKHIYELEDQGLTKASITSLVITDNWGGVISSNNISASGKTMTLKHTVPGVYGYNVKINYTDNSGKQTFAFVPFQVFVYDVSEDKTFVLDYGLPVTIDKNSYTVSSDFSQPMNKIEIGTSFDTAITIQQITGTKPTSDGTYLTVTNDLTTAYANISLDANGNITYTPTSFLNSADYIYVVFKVARTGSNTKLGVSVADEVLMYKTITVLPSNVVYYEDTIGTIKYPNGYTLTPMGNLDGTGVSGQQDFPATNMMGFDDGSYAGAKDVMLSGESVQKVPVNASQVTVTFSFKGTGFELISRVNAYDAATILVKVSPKGQNNWTWYPVITRFNPTNTPGSQAEVYQVPVFRLNEVAYGEYDVEVVGLPMQDYDQNGNPLGATTSYIYIDGIRIYNPLGTSDLTSNYGAEQDAKFENLRDLILGGKGTLAAYTDSVTGFTTGNYYYVATEDDWFTAAYGSINELGCIGANNEIYVRKDSGNHIVVLKVKEDSAGTGLLQIGIHDVHEAKFDGNDTANAPSSVSYNTTSGWVKLVNGTYSGTEQYYSIDLSKCPTDNGYKVVVLRVDSGFVSFSNIKHKNVTFGAIGEQALDIYLQPGFYFNETGDMCTKNEQGDEVVIAPASELFNLNLINDIMAQGNAENE